MFNESKKLHSIKVKFGYVFDDVEPSMVIFKTVKEFEKWEARNPECDIYSVKARYYKK